MLVPGGCTPCIGNAQRWQMFHLLAEHPLSKDVEDVQLLDPPISRAFDSALARGKNVFSRWE